MKIKLIKNTFYNETQTKQRLCDFLIHTKTLSMGEECAKAEINFSKYIGKKYCVLVNSGSSANLALVQAYLNLGRLKHGNKVGFSSLTWSTNVMPIIQLGLIPVPIDISLDTLNVMSSEIIKKIKEENIKAFFSTNVLGFAGDLDKISNDCKENNILFFEDNCESFGSVYKGTRLGNFGNAGTYSFYVGHHLSTIEGGAICTDDDELYNMLMIVRAHGWDRNLTVEKQNKLRRSHKIHSDLCLKYTFYDLGYNLRPTELTGFLLNLNLEFADKIIETREKTYKELYQTIKETFGDLIYLHTWDSQELISNFAMPIVFKSEELCNKVIQKFTDSRIEIRPIIAGNIINQPFFKKYFNQKYSTEKFPNVNIAHRQGFYFGNNPDLTKEEIEYIKSTIASFKNKK